MHRMIEWAAMALLSGFVANAGAAEPAAIDALRNDMVVIQKSRQGLASVVDYMRGRPALFPRREPSPQRALKPAERQEVADLWSRFLDHQLMLDAVWQRLADTREEGAGHDVFRTGYAAFLARYRYALDFIALADADPAVRTVLNEAVPELGLPAGSYADFKFRFLNVAIATEFAALSARSRQQGTDQASMLAAARHEDEDRIWKAGQGHGVVNTVRNAGQIAQEGGKRLVFPVQKGVSEWMGDTRVLYGNHYLIAADQIAGLLPTLKPGDVLLERREWFVSNVGLPGYWPHAALYMGTVAERTAFFADPEVRSWLASEGIADGDLEKLLKKRQPVAYEKSLLRDEHGDPYRILEAMSEGVLFTTLEHSAASDAVAVLRPRLSRVEIAKALLKALSYYDRPYDFDFDFRTDATIVCTELVYKAYAPAAGKTGLNLPLRSVAGRPVITANDIARFMDEHWDSSDRQFDLIAFLDGNARDNRAVNADATAFRASWKRPKWHILTQDTPMASK